MSQNGQERLVLTFPADPALALLARLAARYFLRQLGLRLALARRQGAVVETRCARLLRATARAGRTSRPVVVVMVARRGGVEVTTRLPPHGRTRTLLRLDRPDPA